jgi:hypothetical protein
MGNEMVMEIDAKAMAEFWEDQEGMGWFRKSLRFKVALKYSKGTYLNMAGRKKCQISQRIL